MKLQRSFPTPLTTALVLLCFFASSTLYPADGPYDLQVSHGKSVERVSLRWTSTDERAQFYVYRAEKSKGPFVLIGSTDEKEFIDENCEAGIEYYYKIGQSSDSKNYVSSTRPGFRKIDLSSLFDLDTLFNLKNRALPFETNLDKQRQELIKSYYTGWLKIRFILFITKPYIINKRVFVLSDFDEFSYNKSRNEIIFYPAAQNYSLQFYSREPFALLESTGDEALFKRLVRNSIAFCVYKGEIKIIDRHGRNKYIPQYEAVGLVTQYHKYYHNWPDTSILFSSNREDLMSEIAEFNEQDQ